MSVLDCSGAVSRILHAAGLLSSPTPGSAGIRIIRSAVSPPKPPNPSIRPETKGNPSDGVRRPENGSQGHRGATV